MGCGASNDAVANIRRVSNVAIAPSLPSLQRQRQQSPQQEEIIRHPVASQMSAGNRKKKRQN